MQPKVAEPAQPEPEAKERDYAGRLGSISSSIFSVGDLFRDLRDGTKTVRYPKDLIKVLEQKLQDIAMGKDPAYAPTALTYRTTPYIAVIVQLPRAAGTADDGRFLWTSEG